MLCSPRGQAARSARLRAARSARLRTSALRAAGAPSAPRSARAASRALRAAGRSTFERRRRWRVGSGARERAGEAACRCGPWFAGRCRSNERETRPGYRCSAKHDRAFRGRSLGQHRDPTDHVDACRRGKWCSAAAELGPLAGARNRPPCRRPLRGRRRCAKRKNQDGANLARGECHLSQHAAEHLARGALGDGVDKHDLAWHLVRRDLRGMRVGRMGTEGGCGAGSCAGGVGGDAHEQMRSRRSSGLRRG